MKDESRTVLPPAVFGKINMPWNKLDLRPINASSLFSLKDLISWSLKTLCPKYDDLVKACCQVNTSWAIPGSRRLVLNAEPLSKARAQFERATSTYILKLEHTGAGESIVKECVRSV